MITMTRNDIINATKNSFYNFGHEMIGTGAALIVDKLAHKIFDIEENTNRSYAVKFGSCLVGYAICRYVAPQTPVFNVAGRVVCELLVMGIAFSILFNKVGGYLAKGAVVLSFCGPVGNFASTKLVSTFLLSQKVADSILLKGSLLGYIGNTRQFSFNGFLAAFDATGLGKILKEAMGTDSEDDDTSASNSNDDRTSNHDIVK